MHTFVRLAGFSLFFLMPCAHFADADADAVEANSRYLAMQQARPDMVPFTFDVTVETLTVEEKDGEEVEFATGGSFRVNPAMPIGSRVTILTAPEEEDSTFDGRVDDFNSSEDLGEHFWCGPSASRLEENAAKPAEELPQAEIISETEDAISFRLVPPDKIVLDRDDYESNGDFKKAKKAARHLARDVTYSLETGQQITSQLYLTKSFKPAVTAKVHSMNSETVCGFLPELAASFIQSETTRIDATVLGVISAKNNSRVSISNLQPLSAP